MFEFLALERSSHSRKPIPVLRTSWDGTLTHVREHGYSPATTIGVRGTSMCPATPKIFLCILTN